MKRRFKEFIKNLFKKTIEEALCEVLTNNSDYIEEGLKAVLEEATEEAVKEVLEEL